MLRGMLNDSHDETVSSKRVIAFAAFILCAVAFVANLFWSNKVDAFMFDAMIYLAMVGIGATAVEKFVPRRPSNSERKNP